MNRVPRLLAILIACLALLWPAVLCAQFTEGTIVGSITDQAGAAVVGAQVTVRNTATGSTMQLRTDNTGFYRAVHLNPGTYQVRVEKAGFKAAVVDGVVVNVNVVTRADVILEVGAIHQTVTVSASQAVPLVQTEEARLSATISSRQVTGLPLNGREVYQLVSLQPGVTATNAPVISNVPSSTSAVTFNFGFSANGTTPRGNNFVLDGTTNNNEWLGGTPLIFPSLDAIQELQVQTLNFSAEYGRNNGAVVNVVTKSGTNELHGTVFYFHRNRALNARNFFEGSEKAPLIQHQFGFSLGGPIRRGKTFFFLDYEGSREKDGTPALFTVETPQFRNLVFTQRPDSIAARFLHDFPAPPCLPGTSRDVGSIPDPSLGSFAVGPPDGIPDYCAAIAPQVGFLNTNQYLIRVDHNFGAHDQAFARWIGNYASADVSRQELVGANIRGFQAPLDGFFADLAIGYTHEFSSTTLNDFRFAYSRNNSAISVVVPPSPSATILQQAGVPNFFAQLSLDDGVAPFGGEIYVPRVFVFNTFSANDVLTHIVGHHTLKFGFEVRRIQENSDYELETHPFYEFNSIFNFANDDPYLVEALVGRNPSNPNFGQFTDAPRHFRWTHWAGFVQDDWKVLTNLTLNLGLRYEIFGHPSEVNGILSNIILGPGANIFQQISTATVGRVSQMWKTDYHNFAPRIGVAWDPSGKGKMSVRAGFGIAYLEPYSNLYSNASRLDPPDDAIIDVIPSAFEGTNVNYTFPFQPSPDYSNPVTANGGIEGSIIFPSGVAPHLKTGYSMQWFFGIQHELFRNYAFSINYVGTRGVDLYTREDYNRFAGDICNATTCDFTNNRLNPGWGQIYYISNEDTSTYHGMNVQFKKNYSHGMAFTANYTLGKALDLVSDAGLGDYFNVNNSGLVYSGVQDINKRRADYGPSEFDVRHRFTFSGLFELPSPKWNSVASKVLGGWEVNPIVTLQSGRPFDVFCTLFWFQGCDFNMDGLRYDRPNAPAHIQTSGFSESQFVNGVFKVTDFCPNGIVPFFLGTPCVPVGQDGTLGRNVFRGPSFKDVDLAVVKNTRVSERFTVQFRTDFFNLFNQVNLYNPDGNLGDPTFGRSTQAFPSRQIQFGLKILF
jgi:Carboxypeptidase regulatory-like domain/TonB dependent receptor-like, beta-barrel